MNAGTAVAPEPAPTRSQFKPLREATSIAQALRHPAMVAQFKQALPKHLSVERMLRVCMMAVQRTPDLGDCDIWTLARAMLTLASLGMEPNTPLGHAYLIPFAKRGQVNGKWQKVGTEVNVIIGYRGFIDLARRTGSLISIHADVVYEGDEFDFWYGTGARLKHVPGPTRGRPIWAYCHAQLTDGQAFEVRPYSDVLKIRDASQGYQSALRYKDDGDRGRRAYESTPWVAFEREMACKTMVRSIAKMLPMSIELANAVALDGMSEAGKLDLSSIDFNGAVDLEAITAGGDMSHDPSGSMELGAEHERAELAARQSAPPTPAAPRAAPQPPAKPAAPARPSAAPTAQGSTPAAPAAASKPEPQREPDPPPADPEATPEPPAFENYMVDEVGEVISDAITDPLAFVRQFEHVYDTTFPADRPQLLENNDEALTLAAELSTAAAEIVTGLQHRPPDEQEPPAPAPLPCKVPEIPLDRGKPSFNLWNEAIKAEVGALNPDSVIAFIDAIAPMIATASPAARPKIASTLVARCSFLGITPPPSLAAAMRGTAAAPAADQQPAAEEVTPHEQDRIWADTLIRDVRACATAADARAMAENVAIKSRVKLIKLRNEALFAEIDAAFNERISGSAPQ